MRKRLKEADIETRFRDDSAAEEEDVEFEGVERT